MRPMIRFLLPALACAVLGACVETRFESPLGDNIETCDTAWKGLWFEADDDMRRADGERHLTGFAVDEACAFTLLEQPEAGGPLKRTRVPINYVHAHGDDYVVVSDAALHGLVDLKAPYDIDPPPQKSFFFAKYRVRGDRLEVRKVDDAKAAKLVVDGTLEGTVQKSRNELHVYVRGGRQQMLDLVRRHDLFESKPSLVFTRSREDLQDFERSLQRGAAQEPRR
ncbi:hypothetical protein FHW12_000616 [Dokdonella fugitiva]|uniref:Lipoprotein n=1 Tax=Dokdonella fugitiva TaxID=328517 RepID=A0A839ERP4_9GAMM|nr:hypothetical protein [Dokdonella fugitiva]MBA8886425.1 hypothetical protein [Dokdonella fugitiva]